MTSEPLDIVDIHGILVDYLRADAGVSAIVGTRVFARVYPEHMDFPACKVVFPGTSGASDPAPAWYTYVGQVECHGNTQQEALGLTKAVQRALFSLEGSDAVSDAAFAAVDARSVTSGVDGALTPQKPRWLVQVETTARSK